MSLFGALTSAVSSISQNVSNTVRTVQSTATQAASSISQNVSQNVSNAVRNVQSTATQAVSSISQNVSTTAAAISGTAGRVTTAVTQAAKTIVPVTTVALPTISVPLAAAQLAKSNAATVQTAVTGAATAVQNTVVTVGNNIRKPIETLPIAATTATGTVSTLADSVIDKRDEMYAGEPIEKVAAIGSDILMPLDLMNVVNKTATGRGGDLTTEDYIGAGIDAASIALGALSGGVGYVALKSVKTGVKGVTKVVPKISKISKVRKLKPKRIRTPKQTTNKAPSNIKSGGSNPPKNPPAGKVKARGNNPPKNPPAGKVKGGGNNPPKNPPKSGKVKAGGNNPPKTGMSLGDKLQVGIAAITAGLFGWMAFAPVDGDEESLYPEEYDPGYYDNGSGGEYYDSPILPDELQPLEEYAEDIGGYLEDVPIIGDIAEEARKHGLSLPFLIAIGVVAFVGGHWVWKKYKSSKKTPVKKAGTAKSAGKRKGTAA